MYFVTCGEYSSWKFGVSPEDNGRISALITCAESSTSHPIRELRKAHSFEQSDKKILFFILSKVLTQASMFVTASDSRGKVSPHSRRSSNHPEYFLRKKLQPLPPRGMAFRRLCCEKFSVFHPVELLSFCLSIRF